VNDWFEAERRVERAQQLSEAHQWTEALAEIEAALAINPNHADWHVQRGYLLDELDRPAEAVAAYERALQLEPGDEDALEALGNDLAHTGELTRALSVFAELARLCPDYEPAYCQRIGIYAQLGQHDRAEEMFYLAQELDDECPACFFQIGRSLEDRGERARALYCWQRVLQIDPEFYGVRQLIAQAYRQEGKLAEARDLLLEELRNDPGDLDLLWELAELATAAGDLEGAAARFTQIVELVPEHPESHLALGKTLLRLNRPNESLRALETADRLYRDRRSSMAKTPPTEAAAEFAGCHPGDLAAAMGEALLRLQRVADARSWLRQAAESGEQDAEFQLHLGHCLVAAGLVALAADCYRRVLAQDATNHLAHHQLGVCLLQEGNWDGGLDHFVEANRQRPDFVPAVHNAVLVCAHLRQWTRARELLRAGQRDNPGEAALLRLARRLPWLRVRSWVRRLWPLK